MAQGLGSKTTLPHPKTHLFPEAGACFQKIKPPEATAQRRPWVYCVCRQDICCVCRQDICCVSRQDICCVIVSADISQDIPLNIPHTGARHSNLDPKPRGVAHGVVDRIEMSWEILSADTTDTLSADTPDVLSATKAQDATKLPNLCACGSPGKPHEVKICLRALPSNSSPPIAKPADQCGFWMCASAS